MITSDEQQQVRRVEAMNKGYIVNVAANRQGHVYCVGILFEMNVRSEAEAIHLATVQVCKVEGCSSDDCEIRSVETIVY